ncbi:hypothetical protein [Actinophytocola sediminis]
MTPRTRRPDGGNGSGDGTPNRPSQRSGDVDASSSISTAQQSATDIATRGRPSTAAGNGQSGQPNQPGSGESSRPEWLRERIEQGNEFNRRREPYYEEQGGANEVHVEPRSDKGQYPRVDSYVPGEEIVSRKHTQLADVQESTAVGYLRELANTYGPGTVVADTPTNRRDLGDDAIGQPMDGDMVLEVPAQTNGVPPAVLAEARRLGIIIRDENGHTY